MRLKPHKPSPATPESLASELAERVFTPLQDNSWPERLKALMELHDQLCDDIEDFAFFCETFPLFIEKLIDRFGGVEINESDQAQIYATSARAAHREAAGAWLRAHANQRSGSE